MSVRRQLGGSMVAAVFLACATVLCMAQSKSKPSDNPAPCSVAPQPDPCGTAPAGAADSKSAAQKFPFPGETAAPSTAPTLSGLPAAPDSTDSASPALPAAKAFPFPEEAAKPDAGGTTGSSSSSSAEDASPGPDANAPGASGPGEKDSSGTSPTPGRHLLHRVNPVGTKLQTQEEREAEDLSVAHFYIQTGNIQGAYLRGQDAVKTAPNDPDAHFALAEIAQKLNKRDEAIAEYKACLKLDASDKEVKDARKALARLQP
jgi:hypothetical protein